MESRKQPFRLSENPFVTGQPVKGNDFFGRSDIIQKVFNFLRKKNEYNCLIYGQRRIGKTSLLRHLEMLINEKPNLQSVYINLQDKSDMLLKQLVPELAGQIALDLKIDISKFNFSEPGCFYLKFLPYISRTRPTENFLILLFDEFDAITKSDLIVDAAVTQKAKHSFVAFIRKTVEHIQQLNLPIKFVFAVGRNYKDLEQDRFGQILKFGPKYEIDYFDLNTVKKLALLAEPYIPFSEQALKRLYELGAGHPLFTQCLAAAAFVKAENEHFNKITPEIIERQFNAAIESYGSNVYWIWDSLTHHQMIVLYILAFAGAQNRNITEQVINQKAEELHLEAALSKLPEILQQLINAKFILLHNGSYLFYSDFFRTWIVKEISLETLKKFLIEIVEDK